MSNLENSTHIEKLQECLLKLNKEINKMCQILEKSCQEEASLKSDSMYERESDSDETNTRQH